MKEELKDKIIHTYFSSLRLGYEFKKSSQSWKYYVQMGRVMSHLLWLIIGLKQIDDRRILFDMRYYIKRRCEEFHKHY